MSYKIGKVLGSLINISFYVLFGFDAYRNVVNHRSFGIDVLGVIVLILSKELTRRLFLLYQASEFIALTLVDATNSQPSAKEQIDDIFNDLTKDL
jgi:hypothetical protein